MTNARQFSLYLATTTWAIIIGGVVYSHIVYFPPYLSHLPESTNLITGDYGLQDGNFWRIIHPIALLSIIAALILNWKLKLRRKFILVTISIYVIALVVTIFFFFPELVAFADSANSNTMTESEWFKRGQTWQHLSWIRGFTMFIGFVFLLLALTRDINKAE